MTNHPRQLTTDLHSYFTQLSLPYQCRKSFLSYGIWDSTLNMIEIIHQHRSASKCFLSMGMTKNSKLYLYPEEAMFMMQCSLLQVSNGEKESIPMALDEAYSSWFNQREFNLRHLHVYQYLTRIGFILIRHRPERMMIEKKEDLPDVASGSIKRKRDDDDDEEEGSVEQVHMEIEDDQYICPIHSSVDCQRQWFPSYTTDPPLDIKSYPRLVFPDRFSPVHIDWIPSQFNSKVSNVQLSVRENRILSPRPSYALLHAMDLQSHSTIYQRLSSIISPSDPSSQSLSNISFDMYTPRKHFRKSQPDVPDYYLQIKNGNNPFDFDEMFHHQSIKTLTAVVHNGDISFYTFKSFDPIAALQ